MKVNGLDVCIINNAIMASLNNLRQNAIDATCEGARNHYLYQMDNEIETLNKVRDVFDQLHVKREGFEIIEIV